MREDNDHYHMTVYIYQVAPLETLGLLTDRLLTKAE